MSVDKALATNEKQRMTSHEVLIGVCGGIAAYKTAALVSQLVQAGIGVHGVMTTAATRFVGPATFAALSGRPVATEVFDEQRFPLGAHITLSQQCELFCVAPATANFLAKAAQGLADDLLSTLFACARSPVLLAPAMNCEMWEHAPVQRNVAQLKADGVFIVEPEEGWLSCRQTGVGRMATPERILAVIQQHLKGT
jgi:phosphopantothenoylcysteine decarboxylase/phosphopantothenate--cysteine ligase